MDNDAYDDATLVKVSTKCPPFPDSLKYELVSSGSEQFLFSAVGRLFFFFAICRVLGFVATELLIVLLRDVRQELKEGVF